jgi:hypothetical protein
VPVQYHSYTATNARTTAFSLGTDVQIITGLFPAVNPSCAVGEHVTFLHELSSEHGCPPSVPPAIERPHKKVNCTPGMPCVFRLGRDGSSLINPPRKTPSFRAGDRRGVPCLSQMAVPGNGKEKPQLSKVVASWSRWDSVGLPSIAPIRL